MRVNIPETLQLISNEAILGRKTCVFWSSNLLNKYPTSADRQRALRLFESACIKWNSFYFDPLYTPVVDGEIFWSSEEQGSDFVVYAFFIPAPSEEEFNAMIDETRRQMLMRAAEDPDCVDDFIFKKKDAAP